MSAYPQIGSKYTGPDYDRPCLRQLPSGWVLEEAQAPAPWWQSSERWLMVFVILMLLLAGAQAVNA